MATAHTDRIALGWSREQLARASGVSVAAVYLFERMGTAGSEDDARIRSTLIQLNQGQLAPGNSLAVKKGENNECVQRKDCIHFDSEGRIKIR